MMINQHAQTTTVEFSKEKLATIAVRGYGTTLSLQQLLSDKEVGEKWKPEDAQDLPKVLMNFHKVESVDVVIDALKHIRHNLLYPHGTLHLAC